MNPFIKHIISKSDQLQSEQYQSGSLLEANATGQLQDGEDQINASFDKLL